MPEADTRSNLDQPRVFCRAECASFDAEPLSRAPDKRCVARRFGGGQQQQSLRQLRQVVGALEVVLLEMAREVTYIDRLKAAGQPACAHDPGQIEQSERIAASLGDDAVADAVVERPRDGSPEETAGILIRQPAQRQVGQSVEVLPGGRLADRDYDCHRFGQQPSGYEAEDQSRGGVEPMSVVHETEQRPLLGFGGQQPEYGQPDQEPLRDLPGREAQRDTQTVLLRLRKRVKPGEHRRTELMDPGVGQLHLGLHTCDVLDMEASRLTSGVLQQRRFADTSFAPDDEDGALTAAHVCEQAVDYYALAGPA
jgi:hypothetical protein